MVPAGEHDFKSTRNLTRNLTRNFSLLERHFYLLLLWEVITRNNFQGKTVLNQESSKLKSLKTNKKLHITQKFTKNELSVVLWSLKSFSIVAVHFRIYVKLSKTLFRTFSRSRLLERHNLLRASQMLFFNYWILSIYLQVSLECCKNSIEK